MTQNRLIINRSKNRTKKRSQRDYNLGFKLAVVSQVEKANLPISKLKISMEFKAEELLTVKQLVERQRRLMPRLGARKLYFLLEQSFVENGIKIGRDSFFAYLKREQMLINSRNF